MSFDLGNYNDEHQPSASRYRRGCRCGGCRRAHTTKERERRWRRYGRPNPPTPSERFFAKVEKTPTCWLWTASLDGCGYGLFRPSSKRTVRAHRWAYEHIVGAIPDGLELDHLCRVRNCVNPAHLEPVTFRENQRRAWKSHCLRGHEFTDENTHWVRVCKACWKARKEEAS
ncbi:MAG: HNH endonuclease [Actinomycetota bacterium]|nr:HNH endonuclease [Actinomycetota bacterium]